MALARINFSVNIKQAIGELDWSESEIAQRIAATIVLHAETIMAVAKTRAPVLTGALAASGHVDAPRPRVGGGVDVPMGFGGASAVYAHYQHGQGFAPGLARPRLLTWQSGYTKRFHKRAGEGYLYYPLLGDLPFLRDALAVAITG